MKALFLVFILLNTTISTTSNSPINPGIYHWKEIKIEGNAAFGKNTIFEGSTRDLKYLNVSGYRLRSGTTQDQNDFAEHLEHLVIVKEGRLTVKTPNGEKTLVPGSIAMIMPGDEFSLTNPEKMDAGYYVFSYDSKAPVNEARGKEAGGSFMVDWNDLTFKEHDKGGVRQYFRRSTAMCDYYDMHVTTLNAGLKSHPPHTHRAAEIILMIEGDTQMQIGDNFYKGSTGDVYFVTSEIPHGIENTGSKPAMYFAIQWQ